MDLQKYIEANRGPAIETLKELIRIRSDRSSAVEGEDSQIYWLYFHTHRKYRGR